jgi:diguanylate cyclase (GGDEF)-like protein/PAS domain S-box-containing protein
MTLNLDYQLTIDCNYSIFENYKDGVIIFSIENSEINYFNKSCLDLFEINNKEDLVSYINSLIQKDLLVHVSNDKFIKKEFDFNVKDNVNKHLEIHLKQVIIREKNRILLIISDISEQKNIISRIQAHDEFVDNIFQSFPDSVCLFNLRNSKIIYSNNKLAEMLGYSVESFGNYFGVEVHHEDLHKYKKRREKYSELKDNNVLEDIFRFKNKDGNWRWFSVKTKLFVSYPEKQVIEFCSDITQRKEAEDRLMHDALYDTLTGLPNRSLFLERLSSAVSRKKRKKDTFAVLFLDLDRFKIVNDTLGHLAGDELLIKVSKRLITCVREVDTVARLGGDEFTVLLEDIRDISEAIMVANRIKQEMSRPFKIGNNEIFTTASIGLVLGGKDFSTPEEVLRNADTAMYHAKASGKARYEIFDPSMHEDSKAIFKLETELWKALDKKEFLVHYQPVIELKTNEIAGFEALVRWNHHERGLLYPKDFINMAEEIGILNELDFFVLEVASKAIKKVNDTLNKKLFLSVNMSGKHFYHKNFTERIEEISKKTGFQTEDIHLEITERVMLGDNEQINKTFQQLKKLNIHVHIDDFGTGYSSLSYLHRLPINALKIDYSFITRISFDRESLEIVKTIISLAANLGIETIAEGLESWDHVNIIKGLKCRYGQGFIFSLPMPEELLLDALNKKEIVETKEKPKSISLPNNLLQF